MATLVIKSFPEDLHAQLKATAEEHRRSVTQETICLLEEALARHPQTRNESYWANRNLLPAYKEALTDGSLSNDSDTTAEISEERDAE